MLDSEKVLVMEELANLYIKQGKKINTDTVDVLTKDICSRSYPLGAILEGIKSLGDADINKIRVYDLKVAIQNKIEKDEPKQFSRMPKCQYCEDLGAIFMQDIITGKAWALACCNCEEGKRYGENSKSMAWNKQLRQNYKRRWLELAKPEIMQKIEFKH